jgi:hypothetical protein
MNYCISINKKPLIEWVYFWWAFRSLFRTFLENYFIILFEEINVIHLSLRHQNIKL